MYERVKKGVECIVNDLVLKGNVILIVYNSSCRDGSTSSDPLRCVVSGNFTKDTSLNSFKTKPDLTRDITGLNLY